MKTNYLQHLNRINQNIAMYIAVYLINAATTSCAAFSHQSLSLKKVQMQKIFQKVNLLQEHPIKQEIVFNEMLRNLLRNWQKTKVFQGWPEAVQNENFCSKELQYGVLLTEENPFFSV